MMVSRAVMEQMPQAMAVCGLEDLQCTKHSDQGGQNGADTGPDVHNVNSC